MSFGPRHQAPCKICYDAGRQEEAFQHSTRWNFHDGHGSIVTCPYLRCQTCTNPNCVNHGWVRNPDHAHTTKYCEAPWPLEMQKGGCQEHLKYAQDAFTPEMYQMQIQTQMYAQPELWCPKPEQEEFSVMKPAESFVTFSPVEEKIVDSLTPEMVEDTNTKTEQEVYCVGGTTNDESCEQGAKGSIDLTDPTILVEEMDCNERTPPRKRWADMCDELSDSEEEEEEEELSSEVNHLRLKSLWKRALLFARVVARFNLCVKKKNECASGDAWEVNVASKKLVVSMTKALNKVEEIKAHNCMVESNYGFEEGENDQDWLARMAHENNRFPSLCRHFEKKGCCDYGEKNGKSCNFLHIPRKKRLPVIRFKVAHHVHKKKKVRQRSVKSNNRFAFEDSDSD